MRFPRRDHVTGVSRAAVGFDNSMSNARGFCLGTPDLSGSCMLNTQESLYHPWPLADSDGADTRMTTDDWRQVFPTLQADI